MTFISKYDDACSFAFFNDTAADIMVGDVVEKGALRGVVVQSEQGDRVCVGHCGLANFVCGPVFVWRVELDAPLAQDLELGEDFYHPDNPAVRLGAVVASGEYYDHAGLVDGPAAKAGDMCVCVAACVSTENCCIDIRDNGDGTYVVDDGDPETPNVVIDTTPQCYKHAEVVTAASAVAAAGAINAAVASMPRLTSVGVLASGDMTAAQVAAFIGALTLPSCVVLSIQNVGDGDVSYTDPASGVTVLFKAPDTLSIRQLDGQWCIV